MKVLLTGATGFIGSHLAESFILKKIDLILTKRTTSNLKNCQSFQSKVTWVNTDSDSWIETVINLKPDIIVHAAWNGVDSLNRDDWNNQLSNINLMYQLLKIAESCNIKKFISLGSQAEYGQFEGKISEDYPLNPISSYGAIKLAVLELLKSFCRDNHIEWYWLRVFSVFGEREDEKWLIPSVILKMLSEEKEMNFTLGEQKYAYLYIGHFVNSIISVIKLTAPSGIYNISSDRAVCLKDVLNMIKDLINPSFNLKLGTIPYRQNQSMHIEGDSTKFIQTFGKIDSSDFKTKLERVINSYRK